LEIGCYSDKTAFFPNIQALLPICVAIE